VLVASIALRFLLAPTPGYEDDLRLYKLWGDVGARVGIGNIYDSGSYGEDWRFACDYPPVLPIMLVFVSRLVQWTTGSNLTAHPGLVWPVKLLPMTADMGIVFLIFLRIYRGGRFTPALIAAAAFALNPAVLFNSAYWGQTDSLVFLFALLGVLFLIDRRPEACAVALTVAAFTKPFGYVLGPLAVIVIIRDQGLKRLCTAALASLGTIIVLLSPFILAGNVLGVANTMLTQLFVQPYVSNNAHNLWGIVSFWTALDAGTPCLGPLNYRHLGILLFVALYALAFRRIRSAHNEQSLGLLCGVGFGVFFMVTVHQHENHLFGVLPFLALVWPFDKRVRVVYGAISITCLINMIAHDPALMNAIAGAEAARMVDFYRTPPLQMETASRTMILWMMVVAGNILANVIIVGYAVRLLADTSVWTKLLRLSVENTGDQSQGPSPLEAGYYSKRAID
jgi:dolichyl-phosphate-mannose-protein mannosyltransferase